ncbi:unnamed protein product, partial [Urochloa humidicola]
SVRGARSPGQRAVPRPSTRALRADLGRAGRGGPTGSRGRRLPWRVGLACAAPGGAAVRWSSVVTARPPASDLRCRRYWEFGGVVWLLYVVDLMSVADAGMAACVGDRPENKDEKRKWEEPLALPPPQLGVLHQRHAP